MKIFQRMVLLLKVLVVLSLGTTAAWASANSPQTHGFWGVNSAQDSGLLLAKSDSEPGDEGQGGSKGDDDSTTEEPDTDEGDEGDSDT
ncbi:MULTISPECIES: hypothetical protein [Pseudomonas]|uniref:Uncharacterized protein n=1 Tax=Pseudomonas asplenii TaxID=53407 RepID=A0A0N0VIR7_9PSED|nr:hypothetical protein [Pseudomonas fuscovaginae]KPA88275.1 hypothetical protein PF66_05176 [Pseudomonas fuscovaginae]KPA97282.1 hypothetical protein PF70_02636 [Pseudomonas fuscovaginae]